MRVKAAGGLVVLGALLATLSPVASAQSGYPPGPCTVLLSSSVGGSVAVGGTIIVILQPTCVWTPGAAISFTVNGQPVGAKAALPNGTIAVQVTVLSPTQLSIDDPVLVAGRCGTNSVRGVGPSAVAGGAAVTHETSFQVVCVVATGAQIQQPSRGAIAFTGANVARAMAFALVALVAGALLVVAGRKRRVLQTV